MKLGFIGVGNMGKAILEGLLRSGKVSSTDVFVRNSSDKSTRNIAEETGASTATISRVNRSLNYGNDGYDLVFKRLGILNKNTAK